MTSPNLSEILVESWNWERAKISLETKAEHLIAKVDEDSPRELFTAIESVAAGHKLNVKLVARKGYTAVLVRKNCPNILFR